MLALFSVPAMAQTDSLAQAKIDSLNQVINGLQKQVDEKWADDHEMKGDPAKSISKFEVGGQEATILPTGVEKEDLYTGSFTPDQRLGLTQTEMENNQKVRMKELELEGKYDFMNEHGHENMEAEPNKNVIVAYDANGNPTFYDQANAGKLAKEQRKTVLGEVKLADLSKRELNKILRHEARQAEAERKHYEYLARMEERQRHEREMERIRQEDAHEERVTRMEQGTERTVARSERPRVTTVTTGNLGWSGGVYAGGRTYVNPAYIRVRRPGCTANCN